MSDKYILCFSKVSYNLINLETLNPIYFIDFSIITICKKEFEHVIIFELLIFDITIPIASRFMLQISNLW